MIGTGGWINKIYMSDLKLTATLPLKNDWLVVEPTPSKNMIVKMGSFSRRFGMKIKHI